MYIELLTLGGYGQFVWPAFIFTYVSFFVLYLKTKQELIKQEKMFLREFKHIKPVEIKVAKRKEIANIVLSDNSTF